MTVAYNPDDVGQVWLLEKGAYQPFELIESRFRGKDFGEAEVLRNQCGDLVKNAALENQQAKIDLARHIRGIAGKAASAEDTKIRNIRTTRQREQRKRHIDVVKGDAVHE